MNLSRSNSGPTDAAAGEWVDVGSLRAMSDDRMVVDAAGTSVLVLRTAHGFIAVRNSCPHLGRRLDDARLSRGMLQCAGHGLRWRLATGQSVGFDRRCTSPLVPVPIRVQVDRILIARPTREVQT
jgi:nitrite reductase/ring-hydroxylating ferredoxin subunit